MFRRSSSFWLLLHGEFYRDLIGDTVRIAFLLQAMRFVVALAIAAVLASAVAATKPTSVLDDDAPLDAIPSNGAYVPQTGQQLLWLATAAYCTNTSSIVSWTCNACQQFGTFQVTGLMSDILTETFGFVGYYIPGGGGGVPVLTVVFRGTVPTDIANWIINLDAQSKTVPFPPHPSVNVHAGFWTAYSRLRSDLITGLQNAMTATNGRAVSLITVGHSLGGALSTLAALDLKLTPAVDHLPESIPPASNLSVGVWTYGSPRVGDSAFSELFTASVNVSWRHTHANDVVPHLPLESMGFTHVPIEVYWNEPFNSFTICNQTMSGEQSNCADGALLPISVNDHLHYFGVCRLFVVRVFSGSHFFVFGGVSCLMSDRYRFVL